jgi:hypothetical protein
LRKAASISSTETTPDRTPAFTIVAVLSLALGIGANTAIFSLIDVLLLKPIPVEEPSRLASVFMTDARNPGNLPLSCVLTTRPDQEYSATGGRSRSVRL